MEYLSTDKIVNKVNPLVSVIVQTYQHAPFIAQCLESIIMQQTNFPFEIIVGEDESSDGTREICKRFAEKYPDKIRLFLRSRKDVIYFNGSPTGKYNFSQNMKTARGEYIAECEGDDYWTDPLKLRKQFDFMEKNKDLTLCFHAAENIFKDSKSNFIQRASDKTTFFTIKDVIVKGGGFIPTASIFFRSSYVQKLPEWFYTSIVGDYPLAIFLSLDSKVAYINEVMSVYRRGMDGAWSGSELTIKKIASVNKGVRELLWEINAYTKGQYLWPITQKIGKDYYDLAKAYLYFKLKAMKLK
jgi:glycosyltransferase involved in cell wall biosynthesis